MKPATQSRLVGAVAILAILAVAVARPDMVAAIAGLFGETAQVLWSTPYFFIGHLAVTPAFLLTVFVFLASLVILAYLTRRFVRLQVLARTGLDSGQKFAIEKGIGYFVLGVGLLIGLQATGLDLTSLAFLGGAFGIIIGFGLQNISSNFVSGLILLVERPIKVGDRIEVGSLFGDVIRIGTRSTWIRTNDNVIIIVPNSDFISNRVTNWTANDRQVRFSMPVGVSYGCDVLQVRDILLEVASSHPDILQDPPPEALFIAFGESSLDFELRFWTSTRVQTPVLLKSDLYFEIFRRFKEADIEIPFPQRDLHLRSVDPEARLPLESSPAAQPQTPPAAPQPSRSRIENS